MILRRTNYMVAMFNQEVIRLNIPLPYGTGWEVPAIMTGALQWNLEQCLDFIFDKHGRVHRKFLKPENRDALASRYVQLTYFLGGAENGGHSLTAVTCRTGARN